MISFSWRKYVLAAAAVVSASAALLAHFPAHAQKGKSERRIEENTPDGCRIITERYWDDTLGKWVYGPRKWCPHPKYGWNHSVRVPLSNDSADPLNIRPQSWVGRHPHERIGNYNFFQFGDNSERAVAMWGQKIAPGYKTNPDAMRYGKVVQLSNINEGVGLGGGLYAVFAVPFCLSNACGDPSLSPEGVTVYFAQRGSGSSFFYVAYSVFPAPWGQKICYNGSLKADTACYNSHGNYFHVAPNNFSFIRGNIVEYYLRIQKAFEDARPAEAGSIKWMAENLQCEPVTVTLRDAWGATQSHSEWVCRYKK